MSDIRIEKPITVKLTARVIVNCMNPEMIDELLQDAHVMHMMAGPGGSKIFVCSKRPEDNIEAGIKFEVIDND